MHGKKGCKEIEIAGKGKDDLGASLQVRLYKKLQIKWRKGIGYKSGGSPRQQHYSLNHRKQFPLQPEVQNKDL